MIYERGQRIDHPGAATVPPPATIAPPPPRAYTPPNSVAVDVDPAAAAVELYRMVAGQRMSSDEAIKLGTMLAVGPDGRWRNQWYIAPPAAAVCEARALAGLFLLGERVVWSSRSAVSTHNAFTRLREIINGAEALRLQVKRISAANGQQSVTLHDGRRLLFLTRARGAGRGLSVDCYLMMEFTGITPELATDAELSLLASPNPQLIIGP